MGKWSTRGEQAANCDGSCEQCSRAGTDEKVEQDLQMSSSGQRRTEGSSSGSGE